MRQIAPAPTREEVLAVFADDDRVFSAGEVAFRIYRARGGTADTVSLMIGGRCGNVPAVAPARAKKVLVEMVEDGTLMSEHGYLATRMGSVWGTVRETGQYFALHSSAETSLAEHDASRQAVDTARRLAELLRGRDDVATRVTSVDFSGDRVSIDLTVEQACALFDVPTEGWC